MPNVLVRDLDERVLERLKARAKRNGRSLQRELHFMITQLAGAETLSDENVADKIRNSLRGRSFSDSAELLKEDRSR